MAARAFRSANPDDGVTVTMCNTRHSGLGKSVWSTLVVLIGTITALGTIGFDSNRRTQDHILAVERTVIQTKAVTDASAKDRERLESLMADVLRELRRIRAVAPASMPADLNMAEVRYGAK